MNRKLPLWFTLLIVWIFCVITVVFGWAVWSIQSGKNRFGNAGKSLLFLAKFPHLVSVSLHDVMSGDSKLEIVTDKNKEVNGMKLNNENYVDSNYLLLSSYDNTAHQATVKLVRLSDQKMLHQWTPNVDEALQLYNKMNTPKQMKHYKGNFQTSHPLLSHDGSVYFNFVYSPLIKIGTDSHIQWSLNGLFHHSLEFDAEGNIWSPILVKHSKFESNILKNYRDDEIAKVSPEGKIIFQKSVSEILLENGYRGLIWGVGPYEPDVLHLNDVQPALTSTDYWLKGDLLISLRNKSTVFLYRPSTNKIIWLKTGPWLNQHDADFVNNKQIGIFGNNVLRGDKKSLIEGFNNEYIYDFSTDSTQTPYSEFFKSAKIATLTDGRSDVLSNGDLFVEETKFGRILRGNQNNTIWQYSQRIDSKSVAALFWSRFVTSDEFKQLIFLNNKN
jgi:hypothetical protein